MKNLLTSSQIRDADAYTTLTKGISSADLMETASRAFVEVFKKEAEDIDLAISVYCGTGNNGGDGLAVARLLHEQGYKNVLVRIARFTDKSTNDFNLNLERLRLTAVPVTELYDTGTLPEDDPDIIIDALLGSGLNKPVEGQFQDLIAFINSCRKMVISIDVPSGFPSQGAVDTADSTIRSALTISFQRPKINFFLPESATAVNRFAVVSIGLDEGYIESQPSPWKLIEEKDVRNILKSRKLFSHKGTYGHGLIIAGSRETMGAALLCAEACLHSGAGLTSACIPEEGLSALNTRSPEIMAQIRTAEITGKDLEKYTTIAIGPGMGTGEEAIKLLRTVLRSREVPVVLDADALTMLSDNPELFNDLPADTIITPHMKEFDRMFGEHSSWWQRLETARDRASQLNIIILLKNQYSFIILPDGTVLINPTGNPAMAVGGMGDILTGMITGFLAQGYDAREATLLACYLHGQAGDELAVEGMHSIPPRYLISRLPLVIGHFCTPRPGNS